MKPEGCKYGVGEMFYDEKANFDIQIVGFYVIDDEIQYVVAPLIDALSFQTIKELELDELKRVDVK
jgi:hypothetical protein